MDLDKMEAVEAASETGALFGAARQAEIHARICALREERDLSYRDLAELTGLSDSTIIRYFTGKTKAPQFYMVTTLICVMGGSVDEILGLRHAPQQPQENPYQELMRTYQDNILYQREHTEKMEKSVRRANIISIVTLAILALLCAGVIALFVYDFTHPDRGWWQQVMDAARSTLYAYI